MPPFDVVAEQRAAADALRREFPGMPPLVELDIADMIFRTRGASCVWLKRGLPEWVRAEAMATAWVRHQESPYDQLLPRRGDRGREWRVRLARDLVRPRVQSILLAWRQKAHG